MSVFIAMIIISLSLNAVNNKLVTEEKALEQKMEKEVDTEVLELSDYGEN